MSDSYDKLKADHERMKAAEIARIQAPMAARVAELKSALRAADEVLARLSSEYGLGGCDGDQSRAWCGPEQPCEPCACRNARAAIAKALGGDE